MTGTTESDCRKHCCLTNNIEFHSFDSDFFFLLFRNKMNFNKIFINFFFNYVVVLNVMNSLITVICTCFS